MIEEQAEFGGQAWDHPRSTNVKTFVKTYKGQIAQYNIITFNKDPDINNAYSHSDLLAMIAYGLVHSNATKSFIGTISTIVLSHNPV